MIPNILHFVFLSEKIGGKQFAFSHFMAIKSAIVVNSPSDVFLHCEYEPTGEYWELVKNYITLNFIEAPTEIHGNKLIHLAHKADVIRLRALYKTGGIYLDIDTICVKSLHEFRSCNFVIGQETAPPVEYTFIQKLKKVIRHQTLRPFRENIRGLCNAVMLAEPGAKFIEIWLDAYKTFRSTGNDEFWSEHSVSVPHKLSKEYPSLVTKVSPFAFHYPIYDEMGLMLLFEKKVSFKRAYVHHLWEAMSWEKYLKFLSIEYVKNVDTTYNMIARKYLV